MNKLLPCPICGKEPVFKRDRRTRMQGTYECKGHTNGQRGYANYAADTWNSTVKFILREKWIWLFLKCPDCGGKMEYEQQFYQHPPDFACDDCDYEIELKGA